MTRFTSPPPQVPMSKRLFIKTYGCQMNVYDSARMADLMAPLGYMAASGPEGAEILERAPFVDIVFGPQAYHRLPEMVARAAAERVLDTSFPAEPKFDYLPETSAAPGVSALLTVQEGCD